MKFRKDIVDGTSVGAGIIKNSILMYDSIVMVLYLTKFLSPQYKFLFQINSLEKIYRIPHINCNCLGTLTCTIPLKWCRHNFTLYITLYRRRRLDHLNLRNKLLLDFKKTF